MFKYFVVFIIPLFLQVSSHGRELSFVGVPVPAWGYHGGKHCRRSLPCALAEPRTWSLGGTVRHRRLEADSSKLPEEMEFSPLLGGHRWKTRGTEGAVELGLFVPELQGDLFIGFNGPR